MCQPQPTPTVELENTEDWESGIAAIIYIFGVYFNLR